MKKIIFLLAFSFQVFAQKNATIIEQKKEILTYPYSNPNPIPVLTGSKKHIYPYHSFDDYSIQGKMQEWKVVTLENDFIIVYVLPEVGGKVWGAIEKSTGKEFIYKNEVMKFRNISLRGPWTSGGIEFNFGIIGHSPSTATPVDYLLQENADGSVSCFVGNIDLPSRTNWRVEIKLPKDKAYFETNVLWDNPTDYTQNYYNFITAAAKVGNDLEFMYPGNKTLDHNGDVHPWPVDEQGHDLSFYKNDNFGSDKSIHTVGEFDDFMGGYFHDSNFGFGHYALYDEMPGRKLWLWSTARDGGIWEDLLTDSDGQYMEFQAGRTFNQYAQSDFESPIKEMPFAPQLADRYQELWFPVKDIGGISEVSPHGVLHVKRVNGEITIGINSLSYSKAELLVKSSGEIISRTTLDFEPMEVYDTKIKQKTELPFEVEVVGMELKYSSLGKETIKRPFKTEVKVDKESVFYLYQQALELRQNRNYPKAKIFLENAIVKEPNFTDARAALADLYLRRYQPDSALFQTNYALQLNTYHPAANYFAGLAYLAKSDLINALESLGWAARSTEFRSAAYAKMAQIKLRINDLTLAEYYADKALDFNKNNSSALMTLAIIYRKNNQKEKAKTVIQELLSNDPLNHFANYEQLVAVGGDQIKENFGGKLSNEFPYQSFLELSMFYYHSGETMEALQILSLAPKYPMIGIWAAFINKDAKSLNAISEMSPAFVFPYRTEELQALEWAVSQNKSWKFAYFYGLNLWAVGRKKEALQNLVNCGEQPDFAAFYISRSFLKKEIEGLESQKDLESALEVDKSDWRIWYKLIDYKVSKGDNENAAELANEALGIFPENFNLKLLYARIQINRNKYDACINTLNNTVVLPFEHSFEGRVIYEQAQLLKAIELMKLNKYEDAKQAIENSKKWNENLGVGKPYNPDFRMQNYIEAEIAMKEGKMDLARSLRTEIVKESIKNPNKSALGFNNLLAFDILSKDKNQTLSTQLKNSLKDNKQATQQWILAKVSGDATKANSFEKDFRDNNNFKIIQALGL